MRDFNPIAIGANLWMWFMAALLFMKHFFLGCMELVLICCGVDIEKEMREWNDEEKWARSREATKKNAVHEWENLKAFPIICLRIVAGTCLMIFFVVAEIFYDIKGLFTGEPKRKFPAMVPDFNGEIKGGWKYAENAK